MENSQTVSISQADKDAQYARDYYYRNRDAVLARMKAKRDEIKRQREENTTTERRGRGRPRVRVDIPKKEKSQDGPPPPQDVLA